MKKQSIDTSIEFAPTHDRAAGLQGRLVFIVEGLHDEHPVENQAVAWLDAISGWLSDLKAITEAAQAAKAMAVGEGLKAFVEDEKVRALEAVRDDARRRLAASPEAIELGLRPEDLPLPAVMPDKFNGRAFRDTAVRKAQQGRNELVLAAQKRRDQVEGKLDEVQAWLTRSEVFRVEADLRLELERAEWARKADEDQAREQRLKYRAPPRPFKPSPVAKAAMAERSDRRAAREAEARARLAAQIVEEAIRAAFAG